MSKRDLEHNEAIHNNWKGEIIDDKGNRYKAYIIDGLTKPNSNLLINYILDMEIGANVGKKSKKGARSYGRLNVTRRKLRQTFIMFQERGVKDISKVKEKQLQEWANDLYQGKIKREDGKPYTYPVDFIRMFKAFWHWHMKVQRKLYVETNTKQGSILIDICEDLPLHSPETRFVYLDKEQIDKMLQYFNEDEQILIKFLFDSITRFPTEVLSLTVKDVYKKDGEVWVNVPSEVSKTFGRHFNLLYCGDALLKYIHKKELKPDDHIFYIMNSNLVRTFNKKLKDVAVQVFGDKVSNPKAKESYSKLSGYDFRHCGAIHLRKLAQKTTISLDSIRHRGGWVDFKMLNYYTQFIGLTGEIKKESLLVEEDKSKMQKQIDDMQKQIFELAKKEYKTIDNK